MDDRELEEFAEGMTPFVRRCVTDAVAPLTARMTELEARPPAEKGDPGPAGPAGGQGERGEPAPPPDAQLIPAELAEQIKSAIHLLHESPPIVQRDAARWPAQPRLSRIEHDADGNLVPVYDH